MNIELNEEQRMIAETAAQFFSTQSPLDGVRAAGEGGFCRTLWRDVMEIGFTRMRLPEAKGGSAASLLDAALVCAAAGSQVAPIPLADGIAGCRLLASLEGEAAAGILADIVENPVSFSKDPNLAQLILEGETLSARLPGGQTVMLAAGSQAAALYSAAKAESGILRAAWLIGAARQAVRLAAAYATERKQFGQPIGSFQAIAHPLAESITDIEAGQLLVWRAIWAVAAARDDAAASLAMAGWWAAKTSRVAVRRALRTFGGYGLSLEYDIHLYFLAINRTALRDGDPDLQLAVIGDFLWAGRQTTLPDAGEVGVDLGMGAAAEAYAAEIRQFFETELTDELRAFSRHSADGHDPAFHRKLASAGYAYPDWPAQWGGQDRSAMEIIALSRVFEQYRWTRVPVGTTNMGARMVMEFGSPELQAEVLPRLADGTSLSCLGFTEPESGSDMFAARTRARRDGEDWIVSGQKMFTTLAHVSDYVLMLTRSDPAQTKHRGITIFFIPLSLPGIAIQPVHTLQNERTNITFYDDVRVPDRYRLGQVDGGLTVMASAMKIEHGGEGYHIHHRSLLEATLDWAYAPGTDGRPIDDRGIRAHLARVATHVELGDLLCRRAVLNVETGAATRTDGPMAKLFATESYMQDAADLMALTSPSSIFKESNALAEIEEKHRQSISQTIYGGTSEIHRGIIAQLALNLPRSA
jgi:alkylation response protein AidB-like acyl-CoA dehydrogenase